VGSDALQKQSEKATTMRVRVDSISILMAAIAAVWVLLFYHKRRQHTMAKKHFTVVRNSGYRGGEFNIRERHNERKNECYHNGDIILDRAHLNVHFLRNYTDDGTPETYEQTFNRLLESGAIVKRGLQADAKVSGACIFSLMETAKETGVNPFDYLTYVFKMAPNLDLSDPEVLEALLPAGYKKLY